jgi:hypothetical protein
MVPSIVTVPVARRSRTPELPAPSAIVTPAGIEIVVKSWTPSGSEMSPSGANAPSAPVERKAAGMQAPWLQWLPPVHAFPQAPQFAASLASATSQPFTATPSQSPHPASHTMPQDDAVQVGVE